ncbi:MAG: peptide-binding protein [Candidatus Wallbacteria bacterium]|nr:peptide-binding protein [Candidatus Wallbacteria bacterium]
MNRLFIILAIFVYFLIGCSKDVPPSNPQPQLPPPIEQTVEVKEDTISLSPEYGDTLVRATFADAVILNPILTPDVPSGVITDLVFNGLLRENENLELEPDLAEKYIVSKDGLELDFVLKKGVRWHDGVEFTAEDVKFTYDKIMDPKTQTYDRESFALVKTLEVIDPYRVKVIYSKPFAPALYAWEEGIIPKHIYEKDDINTSKYNRCPVGTGPFKFVEWSPHEQILLETNKDYFAGRTYLDRFIFKVIPDPTMCFLSLLKGEADMMPLTPDQYKKQAQSAEFLDKFDVYRYPSDAYSYLGFNLTKPIFQDQRVRQALSYATDKKLIIDDILYGYGQATSGPFIPSSWAYDKSIAPYPFDQEKARKLLTEAGWTDRDGDGILELNDQKFIVTITTNKGNETRKLAGSLIQSLWEKVGIKVNLEIVEWGVFNDLLDYKKFDIAFLGWGDLTGDPDPYSMWHSSAITDKEKGKVGDNFTSYSNPEVDKLLEEGRTTFDLEKRKQIYHKFHAIIATEQPYIFLFVADNIYALDKRIHGITVAPAGITYNLEKWYVPKGMQKY